MKDSIEERMIRDVQEAKTALATCSLEKVTREEQNRARLTALKDLFEVQHRGVGWT